MKESGSTYTPVFFGDSSLNLRFLRLPQVKPLIFDFHEIWCNVQQLSKASGDQLQPEDTLTASQRYREAINAIKPVIGTIDNTLINEVFNAEILWALAEAVYLKPTGIPIVLNLISWGSNCFGESRKLIAERLEDNSRLPEEHEFYWNSIILSVIQVDLNAAIRLLRKHSRFEKVGAIQQICFSLESFQTFLDQGLPNPNAFSDTQRKVRDLSQSGLFKKSEQLTVIAGLLIGKNETYEKCARSLLENWYQALPAYTLFTCPGANLENIGKIAQTLYNILCPVDVHVSVVESLNSDIDRPIFSVLCRNLIDVLKQICEKSGLWYFPVHFIDLLNRYDPVLIFKLTESFPALKHRGKSSGSIRLDENNQPLESCKFLSVRNVMVIDYGKALANTTDFWIIASDYLNTVPIEDLGGEPNYDANFDSVNKAEYIYSQAVKSDHKKTLERVAKWLVEKYLDQNCLSEALCWALRSGLPELINAVSNRILSVSNAEALSNMRIFDAMAEQFYRYPNLLLLQRFYEFRRCLSQGQIMEASTRIHELVTSGIAPVGFQLVLFDQIAKLLDASSELTPQLDRDSLYDLMRALNKFQIQSSIISPPQLQKDTPITLELNTKITPLRQALCNALANRSLS